MSTRKLHLFTAALLLLALPAEVLSTDEHPTSLQDQMEGLIETFANKSLFLDPQEGLLPLSEWHGVEYFKRKKTDIKCLRWGDSHFGGSIDFSRLPRSLFSLFIENNELHGSLQAGCLPRPLQIIMASNNCLSGTISWKELPPKLAVLGVQNNALTGDVHLDQVPECLSSLKIEGNQFSTVSGEGGKRLVVSGLLKEHPKPQHPVDRAVHPEKNLQPHMARDDFVRLPSITVEEGTGSPDDSGALAHRTGAAHVNRPASADRTAHRRLFLDHENSDKSTADYSSMYGTDTFDDTFETDTSVSGMHLPLSHSISAHREYHDDLYYDSTAMDNTSENFLANYGSLHVDSADLSPILPNAEREYSESHIPPLAYESADVSKGSWGIVDAVLSVFRHILNAFMGVFGRIFRLITMPISQPYPSSACFANY